LQVNWLADKIATSFYIVGTSTSYAHFKNLRKIQALYVGQPPVKAQFVHGPCGGFWSCR